MFKLGRELQLAVKNSQRLQHLVHAAISFFTVFLQRAADDLLQLEGNLRSPSGDRRRLRSQCSTDYLLRGDAGKRRKSGHHFVEHNTETPDIGAMVYWLSTRLFRRHITHSPENRPDVSRDET